MLFGFAWLKLLSGFGCRVFTGFMICFFQMAIKEKTRIGPGRLLLPLGAKSRIVKEKKD